jgi:hypothetical protein
MKGGTMNDLISREAVNGLIDELARAISDEKCNLQRGRKPGKIMTDILSLPSVEPERKKGKWINEQRWCLPQCSVCGASCFGVHGFDAIKTPYCPTCGAEMEVDT